MAEEWRVGEEDAASGDRDRGVGGVGKGEEEGGRRGRESAREPKTRKKKCLSNEVLRTRVIETQITLRNSLP